MPANHDCRRCPLHETTSYVCVWGRGSKYADVMLVGEAPGADEERLGKPFVGQAGQILDGCLDKAGLNRAEVYISNAVKCRPPGNRDPTKEELGACIRYLLEEIQTVKPKVIVCVGRWRQHPWGRERENTKKLEHHLANSKSKQHKHILAHGKLPAHQHP